MMPGWLSGLAQGLAWIVSMTLLMRWLARSRHRPRPAASSNRLQHPPGVLAVGAIGMLFFVGVMVAASIWPDDGVNVWFYGFFAGMAMMSLYIVTDYYHARHDVSEEGMDFGRPDKRRVVFRWTDVQGIGFSKMWNWFRIELRSGEVVRVSGMMMGLPAFATQVLRQVPAARIDSDALDLLRNAANDRLPPVWG